MILEPSLSTDCTRVSFLPSGKIHTYCHKMFEIEKWELEQVLGALFKCNLKNTINVRQRVFKLGGLRYTSWICISRLTNHRTHIKDEVVQGRINHLSTFHKISVFEVIWERHKINVERLSKVIPRPLIWVTKWVIVQKMLMVWEIFISTEIVRVALLLD